MTKSKPLLLALLLGCGTFFALRSLPAAAAQPTGGSSPDEQLLLFLQPQDEHFRTTCLPQLQAWARQEKLTLVEQDLRQGVPAEITATPAIVFQNARGRAMYASRYAELSTIKNFVRTSRLRTQAPVPLCMDQVLQLADGRALLNAPVKLTTLAGEQPDNWDEKGFREQALAALAQGMDSYQFVATSCLNRTDRAFYCDVHPYRDAAGQLFLSLELYSMFNCIHPVFTTGDQPLRGDSTSFAALFAAAGKLLQTKIAANTQTSILGDAWTPLPGDIPEAPWDNLGLALPANVEVAAILPADFKLEQNWGISGAAIPGVPALFFRFMDPLDRYAGEVPDFTGSLTLSSTGSLQQGTFTTQLQSLTMGMAELDDKVKRKYIYTKRFPAASFSFQLPATEPTLAPGRVNRVPVAGTFRFMQYEVPLTVQAEILPQLDDRGSQQLFVHVQFDLNITDDFGIAGPDGPDPARKTLVFDLNFFMYPK
jgi:polyisoprenoid-binding protein YceI